MIDHHIDNNEGKGTGNSPSDYGPNVTSLKYSTGANTSVLIAAMRKMGVDLHQDNVDHQARAITAWLAMQIDTQQFANEFMTDLDCEAKSYLDYVLSDESKAHIKTISGSTPYVWRLIEQHITELVANNAFSTTAVYGVGVIDDFGIIPNTADVLIRSGFETSIVYGILIDGHGPSRNITLNASGRTVNNEVIDLPKIFGDIFYEVLPNGAHNAVGGGRASEDGKRAMCAGEIRLPNLFKTGQPIIERFVWPTIANTYGKRITQFVPGAEKVVIDHLL